MIDPNNVLIQCPNGHELQAIKTELDKPLVCPICEVTFTPKPAPVERSVTTPPTEFMDGVGSAELGAMSEPLGYPPYTSWLLGLWTVVHLLVAVAVVYGILVPSAGRAAPAAAPASGTGFTPVAMVACLASCAVVIVIIAAPVLQLMWIYRIHKDARRAGHYDGISPGLALGLSFIPIVNYPWTAWTMKKLAVFSASGDRQHSPVTRMAVTGANLLLILGLIVLVSSAVNISVGMVTYIKTLQEMTGSDPQQIMIAYQERLEEILPRAWQIATQLFALISFVAYFWTVRKLETSLYSFLGVSSR